MGLPQDVNCVPHAVNRLSEKKMHACWQHATIPSSHSKQSSTRLPGSVAVHMHKAGRPCGAVRSTLAAAHRRTPAHGQAPQAEPCCCAVSRSLKRSQVLILLLKRCCPLACEPSNSRLPSACLNPPDRASQCSPLARLTAVAAMQSWPPDSSRVAAPTLAC